MAIVLFDSVYVKATSPATFAAELNPPAIHGSVNPGRKTAPYSATDAAWSCGFTAALEADFQDVFPPQHFTPAEVEAFHLGAQEGYRKAEFEDISCPADWDSDMDAELNRMAEERSWQFSYEHGGYNHS